MDSFIVLIFVLPAIFLFWLYRSNAKKEWGKLGRLFGKTKTIFSNARKGEITKSEADKFFDCADEVLDMISKRPFVDDKDEIPRMRDEINRMSSQITMILATRTPMASTGEEIDKLAALRQDGLISDMEFKVFSERFRLSTGDKASGIVKAISQLSEQRQQGAILEGNYHAALWSLLDKLDRKT